MNCEEVYAKYIERIQALLEEMGEELRQVHGIEESGVLHLIPDWFLSFGTRRVTANPRGQFAVSFLTSDSAPYALQGLVEHAIEAYLELNTRTVEDD